ncbi:hypothetical protein MA05_04585 [Comamonas aquatica]|uniref:CHASE2 domain-containing protein n=1 Tax=Comamonas aquatica TaxID=225991 RepID=UPI0005ECA14F|nr:adenylate/guanylate cyclase domain-containing protein [Comamonas aquatica]ANY61509.1 hypothetical protein MA05_04585 [Comamonas aquatica]
MGAMTVRQSLSQRLLDHPWQARLCYLVTAVLLWYGLQAVAPQLLGKLQEHGRDLVWRIQASSTPEQRVVLIDIDDASLQAVGPWPWPRTTMADLSQALDRAGVGLKLFDVVFPDARPGDSELATALRAGAGPSVLAQVFALRGETQLRLGSMAGAWSSLGCQLPAVPAQGVIANQEMLAHSAAAAGHITPTLDADGSVRRVAALVCMDGSTYPALALAGLATQASAAPQLQPGRHWYEPAWRITLPGLPGLDIGLDAQGQMRVPFQASRHSLLRISAADLLNGRWPQGLSPEALEGAWVVVGASAFGMADIVPIALGEAVSGSEVHMQLLLGMVDGRIPYAPQGQMMLWSVLSLVALGVLGWLSARRQPWELPVVSVVLACSMLGLQVWAQWAHHLILDGLAPALLMLISGLMLALGEQTRTLLEKQRIYSNLASYVTDPVAEKIALQAPTDAIQARRCELTVLAVDLKNFARYCQVCSPEDAATVLHRFFAGASSIIEAHGGMVEELWGDSLLAVFNGEQPCADHPQAAIAAARAIWQHCSAQLPNTQALGIEPITLGLGLESGQAMIGSFGAARRRVHTVLGPVVNTALQLRSLTAEVSYSVLLGAGMVKCLGAQPDTAHIHIKNLGQFLLPGALHPSNVYTLRYILQPGDPADQRTLAYLQQNMAAFTKPAA